MGANGTMAGKGRAINAAISEKLQVREGGEHRRSLLGWKGKRRGTPKPQARGERFENVSSARASSEGGVTETLLGMIEEAYSRA